MSMFVRRVTSVGYKHAVKPMLFLSKPDNAHRRLVRVAKRTQKLPGIRQLPKLWAYTNEALNTEVAGIKFANPIGLSAGFDKNIELPATMKSVGFGWMTGGSVTRGVYGGNKRPWYHRLPHSKSIVVNAGLPSEGTKVIAERVAHYDRGLFQDFPLNISVAKTNSKECATDAEAIRDYCDSLQVFDKLTTVSMLEINISCPNTFGGEPFTEAKRLSALLGAVDELHLHKPVFVKMPISISLKDYDALLQVILRHNVAGVCVGNLLKDRSDVTLSDSLPSTVKGGLSGAPTRQITTDLIRHTYKKYGKQLVVVGIGGVMSAEDAYEKIKAGASLIALITGLMFEGPQLVGEINEGLVRLLRHDGYTNIAQAVGADATKKAV